MADCPGVLGKEGVIHARRLAQRSVIFNVDIAVLSRAPTVQCFIRSAVGLSYWPLCRVEVARTRRNKNRRLVPVLVDVIRQVVQLIAKFKIVSSQPSALEPS